MSFDFALIIPCYNEAARVRESVTRLRSFFCEDGYWAEKKIVLVLVDDGSTDTTGPEIVALRAEKKNFSIEAISYTPNRGKGAAIKRGIANMDATTYAFMDADLPFDLSQVKAMHKKLRDADLVVGNRTTLLSNSGYAKVRHVISRSLRRLVAIAVGVPVSDTQCGLKMCSKVVARELLPKINQTRFSFDVELISRVAKAGYVIAEEPLAFRYDTTSSVRLADGVRFLLDVLAVTDTIGAPPSRSFFFLLAFFGTAISWIAFGWLLHVGYFFSDDFTWLWHGAKIGGSLHNILTFRMASFYSPVLNAFYTFLYPVFGFAAWKYFAVNIFVHAGVALLSGVLVWQLTRQRVAAYIAVVLAATAGSAYEPLVWIGSNMHSIATLFILGCITSYLGYLQNGRKAILVISFLCLILAFGTKEIAVVTPVLLLACFVWYWWSTRRHFDRATLHHVSFAGAILALSGYYLFLQYTWQKNSFTIAQKLWSVSWSALPRVPLAVADMIVPLRPILTQETAFALIILASAALIAILFRYRRVPAVWFGFAWTVIAIVPVIFFVQPHWYDPLPSRYTYLPRIGVIILISAIIGLHVVGNTSRHIINWFAGILALAIGTQIVFMAHLVSMEYGYVYGSGRTLYMVSQEIARGPHDLVYVTYDRPFTDNTAHIVGVLDLVAHVPEHDIVFLAHGQIPPQGVRYLDWNDAKQTYVLLH